MTLFFGGLPLFLLNMVSMLVVMVMLTWRWLEAEGLGLATGVVVLGWMAVGAGGGGPLEPGPRLHFLVYSWSL